MTDIPIISDNLTLEQKCRLWQEKPYITVDTEFLRTSTYRSQLCLIQIGFEGEGCLIDPLSQSLDLAPLFDVLKNPKITKIFHDARQDMEIFYHLADFCPAPIFDSQIVACALGMGDSVSYEMLARTLLHENIDKSARVTDWSKRPLTERQKVYALSDVTHLCTIYNKLLKQLKDKDRVSWVVPEFEALTQGSFYQNPPELAWKNLRFRGATEKQQVMLEAITAWREEEAQRADKPRGWILRDDMIRGLMLAAANDLPFSEVRNFPKKLLTSKSGKALSKKIEAARANPKTENFVKAAANSNSKNDNKVAMLKLLLKIQCERNNVSSKLITNTRQIEDFAAAPDGASPILSGFRYDVFGQHAQALMNGEISLTLLKGKTHIVKTTPPAPKKS